MTTKRLYNLHDRFQFELDCQRERVERKISPEVEIFMDGNKAAEVIHSSETYSLPDDGFPLGQYVEH